MPASGAGPDDRPSSTTDALITADLRLAGELPPLSGGTPAHGTLVTGATGFLGAALVDALLADPDTTVTCLIRAPDDRAARQRLERHLREQCLRPTDDPDRLRCLAADISLPRFGLSPGRWDALCGSVGRVVHAAARVNGSLPYPALRAGTVLGTAEVLRFALTAGAGLHHVSTLAVEAADPATTGADLPVDDTGPPGDSADLPGGDAGGRVPPAGPAGGYAQSKWVAEELVRAAARRGLDARIYRIGALSGHRSSGASNPADYRWLFLRACLELSAVPLTTGRLCWLPVDVAARAVLALAGQTVDPLRLARIAAREAVPWATVFSWLRRSGHPLRVVEPELWWERLTARLRGAPTDVLAGYAAFAPDLPDGRPRPDDGTWHRLDQLGVAAQPFDRVQLDRCVARLGRPGSAAVPAPVPVPARP